MKYLKVSVGSFFMMFIGAMNAQTTPKKADVHYEPTRDSLSQYQAPEWYHDAKIGFFYHWGPHSIMGNHFNKDVVKFFGQKGEFKGTAIKNPVGQWARHMYPPFPDKQDNQQAATYLMQKKWYGDPKEFGYKDLIPLMSSDGFDPDEMVRLLDEAGVKYIVPQAVHHDGFAMWDSKVIDEFNAAKMGPKKDTTKLVIDAARKRGVKVGVSTHVARHSWYYHKVKGYDTADPRYVQLYGEGLDKNGLPKPEATQKWEDTLGELVDTFHPDYIFVDGGTADIFEATGSYVTQDAFRRIVANYYNKSQQWGVEPVITFKRESLYKEEAVPDYEGGFLVGTAPYKWQTHSSISGWFYRPGRGNSAAERNFRKIIDTVSKNGNMMLNLAIKSDGSIQEKEVLFLKEMKRWMDVVGEGIHASRPWLVYGELEPGKSMGEVKPTWKAHVYNDPERIQMGRFKLNDGDIRFTRSKDGQNIYATRLGWPKKTFTISSFSKIAVAKDVKIKSISLLGSDAEISWSRTDKGIVITPPADAVFEDDMWPVTFKLIKE